MKIFDRYGEELNVGDDVAFVGNGWQEVGYIYKIVNGKVYMTSNDRKEKPTAQALKCGEEIVLDSSFNCIGHKSKFIVKLKGTYGRNN